MNNKSEEYDLNKDPITGEPGAHPLGAGVGATGGAAAGAAIGAAGGPVGVVIGAAVGGIAGGLGGKAVAEQINPTAEEEYWRENHAAQEWSNENDYDEYAPAYQMGYDGPVRHNARFDDVPEDRLESEWEEFKGESKLKWEQAKKATRAGWHRVEHALPGDADGDGR